MSRSLYNSYLIAQLDLLQIEGVVFDMDGVLLDSMQLWEQIGELYLNSIGVAPTKDLGQVLLEMNMEEGAVYLKDTFGLNKSLNDIMDGINQLVIEQYHDTIPLKDGVRELLNELNNRNIQMTVATASDLILATSAFERLNIRHYFKEILTCSVYQTTKKVADIYEKAAEIMGTTKNHTLVFEDSVSAAKTVSKAGFWVAGIYDNSSALSQNELQKYSNIYIG